MLLYLLKVSCCWLGFYGLYYCCLSKETFFRLNRYYLLGTLAAGLIIPLLTLPFSIEWLGHAKPPLTTSIEIGSPGMMPEAMVLPDLPQAGGITWSAWLLTGYWLGVAIAFLRFSAGMIRLSRVYMQGTKERKAGYSLVLTRENHLPFSFGKAIFKSWLSRFSEEEEEKILIHEMAHVKGLHSLDILAVEILGLFFWFNPLIYLYRRSIKVTHEYIADAAVTSFGQKKQYGHLLLRQSLSGPSVALANHFIHSQLKKRINMMMQLPSPAKARLKYLLALPIFISALGLFAQSGEKIQLAPPVPDQLKEVVVVGYPINDDKPLYVIDDRLSSEDQLNEISPSAIESVTVLKGEEAAKQFGDAGKNGVIIIITKEKAGYEAPRFPGCEDLDKHTAIKNACGSKRMLQYVVDNLKYPEAAQKAGTEGTVYAAVTISETGKVKDPKIIKSLSPEIDREVLRVIGEMPDWIPARKNGKAVTAESVVPMFFKLPTTAKGPEEIFKVVEEMPRFPGCEDADTPAGEQKQCADRKMLEYIYTNIKYPAEARKQSIEGIVVAGFVVEKDGTLSNFEVKRGIGGGCDEEVVRVLKQMNEDGIRWIPGVQRGRKVRVQFNMPIRFMLDNKAEQATEKPAPELKAAKAAPRLELEDFTVSPNPTSGQLEVRFRGPAQDTRLVAYDAAGRVVYQAQWRNFDGSFNETIDLTDAPAGVLTLAVIQQDKVYTHQFVKQ